MRLLLLAIVASVMVKPPDERFAVKFIDSADAASVALACQRTAEHGLECIALTKVLAEQERAMLLELETERRHRQQEARWVRVGPEVSL